MSVVNRFVTRLELGKLLEDYIPADPRATLAYSAVLLVLLQSLVAERAPVHKIGEWVSGRDAGPLGLLDGGLDALNDDRVGRALDAESRRRAIEKARLAIGELDEKLKGPRCRLKDPEAVEAAGRAAIDKARRVALGQRRRLEQDHRAPQAAPPRSSRTGHRLRAHRRAALLGRRRHRGRHGARWRLLRWLLANADKELKR